jgi:hypothetical protein
MVIEAVVDFFGQNSSSSQIGINSSRHRCWDSDQTSTKHHWIQKNVQKWFFVYLTAIFVADGPDTGGGRCAEAISQFARDLAHGAGEGRECRNARDDTHRRFGSTDEYSPSRQWQLFDGLELFALTAAAADTRYLISRSLTARESGSRLKGQLELIWLLHSPP